MRREPDFGRFLTENMLCFLALVAWGLGTERPVLGLGLGAVLLLAAISPFRLNSSGRAHARATDLTFVIIAGGILLAYLQRQTLQTNMGLHLMILCPAFLFPKLLFSTLQERSSSFDASATSRDGVAVARLWLEREQGLARSHMDKRRPWDLRSLYFILALFIASFTLPWKAGVAIMLGGAAAYALLQGWNPRGASRQAAFWALLSLVLSFGGAGLGGWGMQKGQLVAEEYFSNLWSSRRGDPVSSSNMSDTAIGRRGRIDNGSKLLMRLEQPPEPGPVYLRNGVFSFTPNGTTWFAHPPSSPAVDWPLFPRDGNTFQVSSAPPAAELATKMRQTKIAITLPRERTALALPVGSLELFGLPLNKIELNEMGVPTTAGTPGFVKFGVSSARGHDAQPLPREGDLDVPLVLQGFIDAFVDEAQARNLSPAQAAAAIDRHFRARWTYTLDLEANDGGPRGISRFLRSERRGHCEYFATAATLAMRRLGFPARYETGFATTEFDAREKLYWVRARDSHAWSTYWDGSAWRSLDATPGAPPDGGGVLDSGSDWLARVQYLLEDFDAAGMLDRVDNIQAAGFGLALALFLGYKLRLRRSRAEEDLGAQAEALCEALNLSLGSERAAKEATFDHWRRLAHKTPDPGRLNALAEAREAALFKPATDRSALLRLCELEARAVRRSLPRRAA